MDKPLVSICCTTYNHVDFIRMTLDGILSQKTTFSYEVIIHDDASTDGTPDIIREYVEKYPKLIRPIFQTENKFSQNIKPSPTYIWPTVKGKYMAFCEGDDYWSDPNKIQKQIDFLEANPNFVGCFTNFGIVNEEGEKLDKTGFTFAEQTFDQNEVLSRQTPKTLTAMIRSSSLPKPFPKLYNKVKNGDTFLFSLASAHGDFKYFDEITGCYRIHSGGIWSLSGQKARYLSQMNTALHMMDYFRSIEQIDALRHRFRVACKGLMKLYKEEGNRSKLWWCKWMMYRTLFKYSPAQLIQKITK